MRALTKLRQAGIAVQQSDGNGMAPEMQLDRIHLDPKNSRRPEDENTAEGIEEQRELTQDIKKRGVKSPVSLRPHPAIAGEYMLNFGHRRFKGAVEAGLSAIPYFIDVTFDSYDQVKENLLHRKPSIWALAEFVQRKLDEGQSKGEIAEGLGKSNQNLVTELHALVDAPSCLHHAYASGVRSPRTMYDLRRAYDEFPEQIDVWCTSGAKITRETIQSLLAEARNATKEVVPPEAATYKAKNAERQDDAIDLKASIVSNPVTGETAVKVYSATAPELSPAAEIPVRQEKQAVMNVPRKLRHDVKAQASTNTASAPLASAKSTGVASEIMVEYQGKLAKIAPDATVMVFFEGQENPCIVLVADLLFKYAT